MVQVDTVAEDKCQGVLVASVRGVRGLPSAKLHSFAEVNVFVDCAAGVDCRTGHELLLVVIGFE